MSALDREKAREVLNHWVHPIIQGDPHVKIAQDSSLDALEKCVLDDVAVTSKLADPAIAWYADQHRAMQAKLDAIREAIAETDTMTLNPGARRALDNVRTALGSGND